MLLKPGEFWRLFHSSREGKGDKSSDGGSGCPRLAAAEAASSQDTLPELLMPLLLPGDQTIPSDLIFLKQILNIPTKTFKKYQIPDKLFWRNHQLTMTPFNYWIQCNLLTTYPWFQSCRLIAEWLRAGAWLLPGHNWAAAGRLWASSRLARRSTRVENSCCNPNIT